MTTLAQVFMRQIDRAVRRRSSAIMGVCNVTPDSFSDGGTFLGPAEARARVRALHDEGADIVDLGAESTRPGFEPIPAAEQLRRLMPALEAARELGAIVSIDTANAEVAARCLQLGVHAINDVSLGADLGIARLCADHGAAYVLMHSRDLGRTGTFGAAPARPYVAVFDDVLGEWEQAAARCVAAGLRREQLVMDPGLGFGKTARDSMELLRRTKELVRRLDVPVLIGASRKSFLKLVDPDSAPGDRLGASLIAATFAAHAGAKLLRVHDVRATRQALDLQAVLATPVGHAGGPGPEGAPC